MSEHRVVVDWRRGSNDFNWDSYSRNHEWRFAGGETVPASAAEEKMAPQFVTVDLGKEYSLSGFTYLPMQERWIKGVITDYEFFVSTNNKKWQKVAEGEFGNIWNNPIEQKINFSPVKGRYIKLKATKIHGEEKVACFAEIGVITK